jgi:hypothetical protein
MWTDKLQNQYANYDEFEAYCEVYRNHERLGFATIKDAWEANPMIKGSTNPDDYGVVKSA